MHDKEVRSARSDIAWALMAVAGASAGAPLDFGKGRWLDLDMGIVSATPAVHAALLEAIQEVSQSGD